MALDFPSTPTIGQKYPAAPIAGVPTYTWDGEKWTTLTQPIAAKTPIYTDGSQAMAAQLTLINPPVNPTDAAAKAYVDAGVASRLALAGGQTITGGFRFAPYNAGTISSGTFTPDAYNGNYQYYTNNGAHTLAAPTSDCAIDIFITNSASAGALSVSGYTYGSNIGDPYVTTNGSKFIFSIRRISGISTFVAKALQ